MKISQQHSHFNAMEHLLVHKELTWHAVKSAIEDVVLNQWGTRPNDSGPNTDHSPAVTAPRLRESLARAFRSLKEARVSSTDLSGGRSPFEIQNGESTHFIFDRVSIGVSFEPYCYAKPLAFYIGDIIDVGVEVLPMKELSAEMSSGVAYYEGELYNLIREGRGVPAVPLVLVGVTA